MKLKTFTIAAVAIAIGAGVAFAAGVTHDDRANMMKKNGAAMGVLSKIAKGEMAYDAAAVEAALKDIQMVGTEYPSLFPSADAAVDPNASPKIWENFDDFKAKSMTLATDAQALIDNLPADPAAVGAAIGKLGASCQSCHEAYRIKT